MAARYSSPEPLGGEHDLAGFSCGEASLDRWLTRYARQAEATHSARVYVTTCDERVVGFFALAAGSVAPKDATPRLMKGQPPGRPVPTVLLARLAVDLEHQGRGVGRSLLQDSMLRVATIGEMAGARALTAHAIDHDARRWYARFGFESSSTDSHHLILLMKDLLKLIDEARSAGQPGGT